MKKILNICPIFPPNHDRFSGGVTNVVYNISMELARKGNKIVIFTVDALDSKRRLKKTHNPYIINTIEVYYFPFFLYYTFILVNLNLMFFIKNSIKEVDLVHIHSNRFILGVITSYYARKEGIPYIFQAHGALLPIGNYSFIKTIYDYIFGNKMIRNASRVIAITKKESNDYEKLGVKQENIEIIPNGIDLEKYQKIPNKGKFRKFIGINKSKIILYLGRIEETKGILVLLYAFRLLIKDYNDVKLIIVGPETSYSIFLKKLVREWGIEEKVRFTGALYNQQKIEALVDADVFVTPKYSGFPITFLEACACGTPIITTDKGDELDWIDRRVGYVVKYDSKELKETIAKLIDDENLKRKFGEEGRRLVRERFNWQIISKKLEALYSEVIDQYEDNDFIHK